MSTPRQGPGRPRDSRIDHTVLATTRKVLAELGYAALTVDAVAVEAGVSKAAIYRRFGSKAEMAFAAAVHDRTPAAPRDTGSLRGDLHALARKIRSSMGNPLALEAGPALIAEVGKDPRLAERFQRTIFAAEREYIDQILERAVTRGELPTAPDPTAVQLLLAGPVFYALFGFQLPVDDTLLDQMVTIVSDGLGAP